MAQTITKLNDEELEIITEKRIIIQKAELTKQKADIEALLTKFN